MSTSLYLITNSKLIGTENDENWKTITKELEKLNLKKTSFTDANNEIIEENEMWSYQIEEEGNDNLSIDFEGSFHIQPKLFSNIGVLYTIYRYRLIYENYKLDWFQSFRNDIYKIISIIGGTEIIYLADNGCDKLSNLLHNYALENVSYETIKQKMIKDFGKPIINYSKLKYEKLSYENINEFILDDFSDLKE